MELIDLKYYLRRYSNYCKSVCSDIINALRPLSRKEIKPTGINRLYLEVTNICNARCIFCAYCKINESGKYKKGIMSFEVFKKAIDDYVNMGGRKISLTPTIGEPLADPGLLDKINYAANAAKIKKIYLYTNGILLNKDNLSEKLVDSGINEIGISSPGFEKRLFESIYGVKVYEEMLSGVISLLEHNKNKGEPVEINFNFRTSERPSQVLKAADFLKYIKPFLSSKVQCTFLVDYDNWGGSVKQEDLKGVMRLKRPFLVHHIPCLRTNDASVLFDGSVRLCGCRFKETEFDELVVGNVMEGTLEEIFFGDKALKIRKSFLDNNPPAVCRDCSLYDPGNFKYPNFIR